MHFGSKKNFFYKLDVHLLEKTEEKNLGISLPVISKNH